MVRLPVIIALAAFSVTALPAFAQTNPTAATNGPAGGVASTTAPSNSQGTPAGGTGTLSTTQFNRDGSVAKVAPLSTTPTAHATPTRHVHHVTHRPVRHPEIGTQSQAGTNGAVPASR